MTTVCSRGCCSKRIGSYARALCVDENSSDFGKIIKIEIPDGYVLMPFLDDEENNELLCEIAHLWVEIEKLRQMIGMCK